MYVKIKRLPELGDLPLPQYAKPGDSGKDLRAAIDAPLVVEYMRVVKIPTGIALELPMGIEAQIRPRSGMSADGILVYWGTADFSYRGGLRVVLQNLSGNTITINRGDRIAQLVIAETIHYEWEEVVELTPTTRGSSGFGSTGIK